MNLLIDTGFWYAFFDAHDQHSKSAQEKANYLELYSIIVVWPILYETVNTSFAKQPLWIDQFERILTRNSATFIDDRDYRDEALRQVFATSRKRPMALCDMVLRLMIDDTNVRVDYLLTFNPGDFDDVCRARRVQIL